VDVAAKCASALATVARAEKVEATAVGRRVAFGGVELRIEARIDLEEQRDSKWISVVSVTTWSPVGVAFAAGSIGIDDSRAAALETAIQEWAQLYGTALVRGVVLKERASDRLELDGFVAYPGWTGFRNPENPTWSKDMHPKLLRLLLPSLTHLGSTRLHSIYIMLIVDADGSVKGECRLDDAVSPAILDAARKFPWPKPVKGYMFKQYYIVEKTQ
jgi:hypothetical protein